MKEIEKHFPPDYRRLKFYEADFIAFFLRCLVERGVCNRLPSELSRPNYYRLTVEAYESFDIHLESSDIKLL